MNKIKLFATAALTAGALFSMESPASAQTIGFKVGQTFSKFDTDGNNSAQDYLAKFGGGGFLRFGLAGIGMQAELLALTKGSKTDGATGVETSTRLDYIEVPVLARFGLGMAPMISPYVMVGP
ncbi:MAG: outer membrane beta-barrel protein, partial [Acidobacteria bacterium]|nr:outer membrane beta-barrel protein [Acidobacteriota bacterium]